MFRYFDGEKPCWVLREGTWREGWLRAWWKAGERWRAHVNFSDGIGLHYLVAVDQDEVRPREPGTPPPEAGTAEAGPVPTFSGDSWVAENAVETPGLQASGSADQHGDTGS